MKERLKALGARLGPFLVVALLAYAGGFWTGRRGPQADKVTEKSRIEVTEDVKSAEKIGEKKAVARRKHVETTVHTEKKPDGTVVTDRRTVIADNTDTKTDTSDKKTEESHEYRTEDHSKVTLYQRNWKVSLLIGTELVNPYAVYTNPLGHLAYGGHVERRLDFIPLPVFDRVWLGGWAVGLGPKADKWAAGVSLGVEF